MTSSVETPENDPCRRNLKVSIDSDIVEKQFRQSYAELRNTITLPGFRKGKAPKSVLEKRFGSQIEDDVKRDLVVEGIEASIKEHGLEVVSDPDLDFEKIDFARGKGFEFDFSVEVRPDFKLPKYTGLKATKKLEPWSDEEVGQILDNLRSQRAAMVPVDGGKVKEKDHVIGPFEVFEGDESILSRDSDGAIAGDEHEKIAGLELTGISKDLIGKNIGDELSYETEVPEDYPVQDMRGKKVRAVLKIAELKRLEMPELDDELAKAYGFDDLKSFQERIESDLDERQKENAQTKVEEDLIDALIESTDFSIPKTVVEKTLANRVQEVAMHQMMQGQLDPKGDYKAVLDEIKANELPEVERSIRAWYLIEAIAKKEKIFATESDVDARIVEMARREGVTPTAVREELAKKDGVAQLRSSVLERKVRAFLTEEADIAEDTVEPAAKSGGKKKKSSSAAKAEEEGGKSDD